MSTQTMKPSIKWAAELGHVQEVSLLGTADLGYWKDRLREEELLPAESDGQAQIMIITAYAKFMGVRFREMSFSVAVSRSEGPWQNAARLIRAFNTSRFFSFCERVLFSTPYYHGDVRLSASLPASVQLVNKGEVVFAAEMGANTAGSPRNASHSGVDGWEGPVFLPQSRPGQSRQGKFFVARLRGHTRTFPFLPGTDSLTIRPSPDSEIFQALKDSHFVAKEWIVREDAEHAKSKTYKRSELLTGH